MLTTLGLSLAFLFGQSIADKLFGIEYNGDSIYNCPLSQSACDDIDCSTTDALCRSGFECNHFPFHNGGWKSWNPKAYITHYEQAYQCSNITTEEYCHTWMHTETTKTTISFWNSDMSSTTSRDNNTQCVCQEGSENDLYCIEWVCGDKKTINQQKSDNPLLYYDTKCACDNDTSDDLTFTSFCDKWVCHQMNIDENTHTISENHCTAIIPDKDDVDQSIYFDQYYADHSSSYQVVSAVDHKPMCWKWNEDYITYENATQNVNSVLGEPLSWKVGECKCQIAKTSQTSFVCQKWICYEKTADYHQISENRFKYTVAVSLIVGIIFTLFIVGTWHSNQKRKRNVSAAKNKPRRTKNASQWEPGYIRVDRGGCCYQCRKCLHTCGMFCCYSILLSFLLLSTLAVDFLFAGVGAIAFVAGLWFISLPFTCLCAKKCCGTSKPKVRYNEVEGDRYVQREYAGSRHTRVAV